MMRTVEVSQNLITVPKMSCYKSGLRSGPIQTQQCVYAEGTISVCNVNFLQEKECNNFFASPIPLNQMASIKLNDNIRKVLPSSTPELSLARNVAYQKPINVKLMAVINGVLFHQLINWLQYSCEEIIKGVFCDFCNFSYKNCRTEESVSSEYEWLQV